MLCFKDTTFCALDCARVECPRHFGEDDKAAAQEWARRIGFDHGEVPVAFSDLQGSEHCIGYLKPEAK